MKRPALLPPDIERLIPMTVEKGIYPRFYRGQDGEVSLVWWVRVWKDIKPISQSTGSCRYSDAVALKKKLIAETQMGERVGGEMDQVRVAKVLDDYIAECDVSDRVRHEYRLQADNRLKPRLGKLRVVKLTTEKLREYRKLRVAEIVAKKAKSPDRVAAATKAANTTVNRETGLLHAALAHGQRRTPRTVLHLPFIPKTSEKDNARQGFLEPANYATLRDAFRDPAIRLLYIVGYNVGCRSGELRQFEWSMVDFNDGVIRLPGRITKNGKPRTVPIFAGEMMDSLMAEKQQRDALYPDSPWVFSRAGEPIKSFNNEWKRATKAANLSGFLFHDLRRTAVRDMVRIHGIDRTVAKKISGHLTDSMFERYNIVDEADIKAAKQKVDAARTVPMATMGSPSSQDFPNIDAELLAALAGVPAAKLAALLALLR